MTSRFFCLLAILIASTPASGSSVERGFIHRAQLEGLNLALRNASTGQERQGLSAAASFTDISVSGSISPAMFDQANASLVALEDGGWLGVWDDERDGARKIFWQRYDASFNPVGGNQLVAGSTVGADLVEPLLAADTLGRIYLAYRDRTLGLIQARRYNPDLSPDLGTFLVNDTSFSSFAGPFDMAVFPNGRMVIVWENYTLAGSSIAARIYSNSGSSVFASGAINDDGPTAQHWVPTAAVQPGAGCLVTWEDYRNGQADIYGQLLAGDGSAIGGNFSFVPPGPDSAPQIMPQSTYSITNAYVVAWTDERLGTEIYAQRYNATTGLVGSNILLSGDDTLTFNQDPEIAAFADGRCLVTWASLGAANAIEQLTVGNNLAPLSLPESVNTAVVGRRWGSAAAIAKNNSYGIAWTEFQDEDADILYMPMNSSGNPQLGSELTMNDDVLGAPSLTPKVVPSTDWFHLVVWQDNRNDAGDIYLRAISNAGYFTGAEVRVNQDGGPDLQTEPITAVSDTKALTVWIDGRPLGGISGQRIYGRFCSPTRVFSENEFIISDTAQAGVKGSPAIALVPNNRALVVWIDRRSGTPHVWGRWLTSAGALDGNEFQLSNAGTDLMVTSLFAGVDAQGRFIVAWLDSGGSHPQVRVKYYNTSKQELSAFAWTSSVSGIEIDEATVDFAPDGSICIGWIGNADGTVYLTELDSSGNVTITPTVVNDITTPDVSTPSISVSENNDISIAWLQERQVLYQVFDNSLTRIGGNEPVTSASPEIMLTPHTDASHGLAWTVWSDPRENGLGIYATAVLYDPTGVDDPGAGLPSGYALSQNYPNPFNPTTTIKFSLPAASNVTLEVYNLLGQKVTTLASGYFPSGEHHVFWDGRTSDGSPVASGVYMYRLLADGFVQSRKMTLLK